MLKKFSVWSFHSWSHLYMLLWCRQFPFYSTWLSSTSAPTYLTLYQYFQLVLCPISARHETSVFCFQKFVQDVADPFISQLKQNIATHIRTWAHLQEKKADGFAVLRTVLLRCKMQKSSSWPEIRRTDGSFHRSFQYIDVSSVCSETHRLEMSAWNSRTPTDQGWQISSRLFPYHFLSYYTSFPSTSTPLPPSLIPLSTVCPEPSRRKNPTHLCLQMSFVKKEPPWQTALACFLQTLTSFLAVPSVFCLPESPSPCEEHRPWRNCHKLHKFLCVLGFVRICFLLTSIQIPALVIQNSFRSLFCRICAEHHFTVLSCNRVVSVDALDVHVFSDADSYLRERLIILCAKFSIMKKIKK